MSLISTYLPIYCLFVCDTVRHSTSVIEWHSSVTEWFVFTPYYHWTATGSFTVLEHKTKIPVCCQMLHTYLSKVHSQNTTMLQFIQISINSS